MTYNDEELRYGALGNAIRSLPVGLPEDYILRRADLFVNYVRGIKPTSIVPVSTPSQSPIDLDGVVFIEELDLSVRTTNVLKAAGIGTLGAIMAHTQNDLLQLDGFGRKSLNEVKELLANMRLRLAT